MSIKFSNMHEGVGGEGFGRREGGEWFLVLAIHFVLVL